MKFGPKHYEQQILRKNTDQNLNQHIAMCPCIKFQSIWQTLDFGTKFAQNYMNDKFFKRINIKVAMYLSAKFAMQLNLRRTYFK